MYEYSMFSFLFIKSLVRKSAASGNLFLPKFNFFCAFFFKNRGGKDILSTIIHLGNSSRERRSHFTVYFTAGFRSKTVPSTMNELYLTWATGEDAYSQCTIEKYSRLSKSAAVQSMSLLPLIDLNFCKMIMWF